MTLTGKILPIGGVKEKTIAAKRSDVKHIIFPEGNKKDFDELIDDIKKDLNVYFFKVYDEVFELALNYSN